MKKTISQNEHYIVQYLNVHRQYEDCLCGQARSLEEAESFMEKQKRYLWNVPMRIIKISTTIEEVKDWQPKYY